MLFSFLEKSGILYVEDHTIIKTVDAVTSTASTIGLNLVIEG